MNYKLFRIVIDSPGIVGNGSDAKEHTELVFEGDELSLREKMFSLGIIKTENEKIHIPVECLSYFTAQKGYILSEKTLGSFPHREIMRGTAVLNEEGTVLTVGNSGSTLTIQWESNVSYSKRNEYYKHFNGKKVKITIEEEA